ncbi:MAG: cobyrinic acid a,c-diamide synthase [Syntrophobacterales bacterium GWC2_56_13]|nr:MAG: cobyrinic acid a,c-diamide synthase [Syntrophobacterales bacterium GWC2_56_13]
MPRCPTLVIAGTHSGSGKTSLALALAHALTRRGLAVQTFKVGPDFLDPTYLALASGRPCYNLDGWMAGREHVCRLFERAAADADVALVEGVMGLFDGADTAGPEGSTAEIARWLDAPILLVANVHGMARSLAALVRGFATFEPDLRIRGVVANHCGSERHAEWLADTLQAAGLPPLVGAIPRGAFPQLASRHLGLVTADERLLPDAVLDSLANALEQHFSLETLFPGWVEEKATPSSPVPGFPARLRIGAARDAAFHFYYQDLFDTLATAGCETVFFSPLSDRRLPEGISGLYLGGGYPEAHAEALAANGEILAAIREYAASRKPLYAECGGLMYLSQGLLEAGGRFHPFLGILPARTRMLDGKKALGYVEITLTADSLWGRCGDVFRGHEFHYSELIDDPVADPAWRTVYALRRRRSEAAEAEGFQKEAILASYTHLYYASLPAAIDHFIAHCGGTP